MRRRTGTVGEQARAPSKVFDLTNFTDLGLSDPILKALSEEGYANPTPIQAKAIPVVLSGVDLLGIAQTGTGKTAAFALPILDRLARAKLPPIRKGARVLVLSPTRELASQIAESFRTYGRHVGLSVAVVYGGVAHGPQRAALARGLDVLVATPGRLIDHMQEGNVDLRGTEVFVLDEADQMLDLGFLPPIRKIVSKLSLKRQNLFFSATMPAEIGKLAADLLRDPQKVSVAPSSTTVERVRQRVIHVDGNRKKALLVELFANPEMTRTLVFTRTKRGADKVAAHLESAGIEVSSIHGNKSQSQREKALAAFKAGHIRGLVATDIAARGIDVDLVTHVINFELPDVPEAYVHRIGRTARAGATGEAISLVDGSERGQLRDIERSTRQQIVAEDRRGDAALSADATPAGGERRERGAGRGGRPQQQRRSGGGNRPQEQRARGPRTERPQADEVRQASAPRPERPEAPRPARGERPVRARADGPRPERARTDGQRPADRGPGEVRQAAKGPRRPGGAARPGGRTDERHEERRRDSDRAPSRPAAAGRQNDLSQVPFLKRPAKPNGQHHPAANARHSHVRADE